MSLLRIPAGNIWIGRNAQPSEAVTNDEELALATSEKAKR